MDYREQLQQSRKLNQTALHSQAVVAAVTQDNESLQSALEKAVSDIEARDATIAQKDATIAQQAAQIAEKDVRIAELEQHIRDMIAQKPNINIDTNLGIVTDNIQNLQPSCQSLSITTSESLQTTSKTSSSRTKRLSSVRRPALAHSL